SARPSRSRTWPLAPVNRAAPRARETAPPVRASSAPASPPRGSPSSTTRARALRSASGASAPTNSMSIPLSCTGSGWAAGSRLRRAAADDLEQLLGRGAPNLPGERKNSMALIDRYLLKQLVGPTILATLALTAVALLSQSLAALDIIVSQRQTALIFGKITLLAMPQLINIVLPIALFVAALVALNRLHTEQEIVV